jgi:anti-sigma factor RsiW
MSHVDDLACIELVELVTDYLEGRLSAEDTARFEQHLTACNGCTAYLEQMRATIALTGSITPEQIEPAARDALLHAFGGWAHS